MFTDELRIGNWVQRIGYPLKVTGIKGSDVWVDGNGVELEYYIYDGINPIPLTEEWLERFGFSKDTTLKNVWFEKKIPSQYLSVCIQLKRFVIGDTPDWTFPLRIEYVHELQNLYFALTGDEL